MGDHSSPEGSDEGSVAPGPVEPAAAAGGRRGSVPGCTGPLTRERILEAAEETLRRFGPGKTTVVDVARALGVSHGTVYRHFASKTELRDSVLEQWLARRIAELGPVARDGGNRPAAERLRRWLVALVESKREQARTDADVFAAYAELSAQSREVVLRHVDALVGQVAEIISAGSASGEFAVDDPAAAARAVFDATARFHHPAHAGEWARPGVDECFDGVWALILSGLSTR